MDVIDSKILLDDYTDFVVGMKVYPEQHKITYPALGLVGEAGEVAEKVKKSLRGDKPLDNYQVILELGDVLWYITALAEDLGYSLEDVLVANIKKLSSRRDREVIKGDGDNR
ncbi:hypothetical protein [Leptolyngbya phage Lbo-JY46]